MTLVTDHTIEFDRAIEHFQQDISTLKTGRANPALLDNVKVQAYGTLTPLNQVASISVPEARSIIISPWDKGVLKEIEKAIIEADLNISPVNEGDKIRLVIPQMTEESRRDIVKLLNQKAEHARITIRTTRDEVKERILAAEKNKEFGEDTRYQLIDELDTLTGKYNDQIKSLSAEKEQEIMTI